MPGLKVGSSGCVEGRVSRVCGWDGRFIGAGIINVVGNTVKYVEAMLFPGSSGD